MIGRGHCHGCRVAWRWTAASEESAKARGFACPVCGLPLRKPSAWQKDGRDIVSPGWKRKPARLTDRGLRLPEGGVP